MVSLSSAVGWLPGGTGKGRFLDVLEGFGFLGTNRIAEKF